MMIGIKFLYQRQNDNDKMMMKIKMKRNPNSTRAHSCIYKP